MNIGLPTVLGIDGFRQDAAGARAGDRYVRHDRSRLDLLGASDCGPAGAWRDLPSEAARRDPRFAPPHCLTHDEADLIVGAMREAVERVCGTACCANCAHDRGDLTGADRYKLQSLQSQSLRFENGSLLVAMAAIR